MLQEITILPVVKLLLNDFSSGSRPSSPAEAVHGDVKQLDGVRSCCLDLAVSEAAASHSFTAASS